MERSRSTVRDIERNQERNILVAKNFKNEKFNGVKYYREV